MTMNLKLTRIQRDDHQTLGRLQLFDGDTEIWKCLTLELPWKNNEKRVSSIPAGEYTVSHHISPNHGECLSVQNVPNRTHILIHKGNYHTQILGCILVGKTFKDINGDGKLDVTSSGVVLSELLNRVTEKTITLTIIEHFIDKPIAPEIPPSNLG